jgi:Tol biopolymer transport system component
LWILPTAAAPGKKQKRSSTSKLTAAMLHGKIVFLKDMDLWIMNPDGSGRKKLLSNLFGGSASSEDIDFSPDLSHVIFTYDPPNDDPYLGNALVTIAIDGTQRRLLVANGADELGSPRFSPDGRKIVYTRWTGKHWGGPDVADADIWIINADGSGKRKLIGDYSNTDYAHADARWSRDGQRIFYYQIKGAIPEGTEGPPVIYEPMSVKLDGSDARSAAEEESLSLFETISPDGKKRIVYNRSDNISGELYIQNIDGTGSRRLTKNAYTREYGARFSPDSKRVIFNSSQSKTIRNNMSVNLNSIWIVNVDGSGLRRLIDGGQDPISCVQWLR